MSGLTHLDATGAARMVDVTAKPDTRREATATGRITMTDAALAAIRTGAVAKGDVIAVARVAGIMAAKRTSDLIPLCHPLPINAVEIALEPQPETSTLLIISTVRCSGRTGVEMEALTAATVTALTIYDMAKAIDRAMEIGGVRVTSKQGGRSGDWSRE